VQRRERRRTKTSYIAGIGRNFGFEQCDVDHRLNTLNKHLLKHAKHQLCARIRLTQMLARPLLCYNPLL
jgi:hypothetical protein